MKICFSQFDKKTGNIDVNRLMAFINGASLSEQNKKAAVDRMKKCMNTELNHSNLLLVQIFWFASTSMNCIGLYQISKKLKLHHRSNSFLLNAAIYGDIFQASLNGRDVTAQQLERLNDLKQHVYVWKGIICVLEGIITNASFNISFIIGTSCLYIFHYFNS